MKFAKFLLKTNNEYNGHKQTEINGLPVKNGLKLCKQLEKLDSKYSFVLELWSDGNYTIYQKDYFLEGKTGGRDRIILSVNNS